MDIGRYIGLGVTKRFIVKRKISFMENNVFRYVYFLSSEIKDFVCFLQKDIPRKYKDRLRVETYYGLV